jgi:2-hydroxychromene-2-carboxylate isomerase
MTTARKTGMKPPLDFYFDLSSPYGYIAAEKIEALASKHGRPPFIVVDGEPFWGVDRLDQVERGLATGGW